uniref:Uncharacterized protein n=1 Tax=Arundo donax TaxID=35708 RepID=A0A0A9ALV0_ARUDO
MQGVPVFFLW